MTHLSAFVLCLGGFTALAFATRRQQRDVFGRSLPLAATSLLRAIGAAVLLFALGVLVARHSWGLGLVMFSGHTTVAAGAVLCTLIGFARMDSRSSR
jgi:hypothetical protein